MLYEVASIYCLHSYEVEPAYHVSNGFIRITSKLLVSCKCYKSVDITCVLLTGEVSSGRIVKVQTYVQASLTLRSNLNGLIIFDTSKKNLDVIAEENNFMKKDSEFVKMFRDNVETKSDFMVVNYTNSKADLYLNKFFDKIETSRYTAK